MWGDTELVWKPGASPGSCLTLSLMIHLDLSLHCPGWSEVIQHVTFYTLGLEWFTLLDGNRITKDFCLSKVSQKSVKCNVVNLIFDLRDLLPKLRLFNLVNLSLKVFTVTTSVLLGVHSRYDYSVTDFYRSGTVNSNTVNSKFHLIRSYCKYLATILSFHV